MKGFGLPYHALNVDVQKAMENQAVQEMAKEPGVPDILASPFPVSATGDHPSILLYDGPQLGKLYNQFTHFIFENAFWLVSRWSASAFWKKHGKANRVTLTPPSRLQVARAKRVFTTIKC